MRIRLAATVLMIALVGCKQVPPPKQEAQSAVFQYQPAPQPKFPTGTTVLRSHVEQCFLSHWTFMDSEGFVTAIDLAGSPFDCERFDGKNVELHYMGKRYLMARVIGVAK